MRISDEIAAYALRFPFLVRSGRALREEKRHKQVIGLVTVLKKMRFLPSFLGKQRKRILIVDTDPTLLWVLQLILEEEGYLIHTSVDASNLEQLLSFQPDLILLDGLLSPADGHMMNWRLKHQETMKHIPIILMVTSSSTAATLIKSGSDAVLNKPFDLDAFLDIVHKYI
jgi:CheY-like chemotaxis protein